MSDAEARFYCSRCDIADLDPHEDPKMCARYLATCDDRKACGEFRSAVRAVLDFHVRPIVNRRHPRVLRALLRSICDEIVPTGAPRHRARVFRQEARRFFGVERLGDIPDRRQVEMFA